MYTAKEILSLYQEDLQSITQGLLVVVDVQKCHYDCAKKQMDKILNYAFQQSTNGRKIVWIHNNNDVGCESKSEMVEWLYEHFMDDYSEKEIKKFLKNVTFKDKTYAFLRNYMDNLYNADDFIVELMQYMIKKKLYDSRDIDKMDKSVIAIFSKHDVDIDLLDNDDAIFYEDIFGEIKKLKSNNIELIGGGRNECLKEIELVFQTVKKPYHINHDMTY